MKNREKSLSEKLRDAEILDRMVNHLLQKKKEKEGRMHEFINGDKFNAIVNSIIAKNIFFDEENFRYFPDKVLLKLGIEGLTSSDIIQFIECMTDEDLFKAESTTIDEDNPFFNKTEEKLGLNVFTMVGQGTIIQIYPTNMKRN